MQTAFTDNAWEDYLYWQANDADTLEKINHLIKEIKKRAHFLLILAPLTLKPRAGSEDVLRIEIETAIDNKRNIMLLESINKGSPT